MHSWLWFGLLVDVSRILGKALNVDDFVSKKNGSEFLSSKSLESFVSQWEALEKANDSVSREHDQVAIDACLQLAEIFSQENLRRQNRYETIWSASSVCALAIQLLHEALRHASGSNYQGADKLVTTSGAGL